MDLQHLSIDQTLILVMSLNMVLSSLHKSLEFIKDKTESKADDNLYAILTNILKVLGVVIEFLSANPNHNKSEKVQK